MCHVSSCRCHITRHGVHDVRFDPASRGTLFVDVLPEIWIWAMSILFLFFIQKLTQRYQMKMRMQRMGQMHMRRGRRHLRRRFRVSVCSAWTCDHYILMSRFYSLISHLENTPQVYINDLRIHFKLQVSSRL